MYETATVPRCSTSNGILSFEYLCTLRRPLHCSHFSIPHFQRDVYNWFRCWPARYTLVQVESQYSFGGEKSPKLYYVHEDATLQPKLGARQISPPFRVIRTTGLDPGVTQLSPPDMISISLRARTARLTRRLIVSAFLNIIQ